MRHLRRRASRARRGRRARRRGGGSVRGEDEASKLRAARRRVDRESLLVLGRQGALPWRPASHGIPGTPTTYCTFGFSESTPRSTSPLLILKSPDTLLRKVAERVTAFHDS